MAEAFDKGKLESAESYHSTIRKMEKALTEMKRKNASTALIRKRLQAVRIGLALIEYAWYEKELEYSEEEITKAGEVLCGLVPSIERAYEKSKEGSPQRTLLERRIISLKQSISVIDEMFGDTDQQM